MFICFTLDKMEGVDHEKFEEMPPGYVSSRKARFPAAFVNGLSLFKMKALANFYCHKGSGI